MKFKFGLSLIALALIAMGCSEDSKVASGPSSSGHANNSTNGQYAAATEPEGAVPVGEARQTSKDGQQITLVGLIGGSSEPFVEGIAAFTVVDESVPYCAPDEGCPTPWDYCCTQHKVKGNIATVKVVDDSGEPVFQDARELLDVRELSTVVVSGKADRDDQGNLTVAATKVFVRAGR